MAWRTNQILVALDDIGEQGESLANSVKPSFTGGPQVIEDNHAPIDLRDAAQRFGRNTQGAVEKAEKAGLVGGLAEVRQPLLEPADRARTLPDAPSCRLPARRTLPPSGRATSRRW